MLYYDPAHPPAADAIAGKILVCATAPYPQPPYSESFLDNFTPTDYEWRSPGQWPPLFTPPPASVTSSYHSRWVWSQLNGFAAIGIKGKAAGMVVVYDLSPGAAFGLAQRSVYTPDGKAGLGAKYVNCPTLTLDRVNGAKVLADAKAGKTATLTLKARFERNTGKAIIGFLPGRDYGTPQDQQVLLATHTDAMSLIEENGGLGMIGIMSYFNRLPQAARPRTLAFYFDCRHFMPGGEGSWPQFDYYTLHPERLKSVVATLGMEHMGGRQTIETGPGGNQYGYLGERPENGGVITSLMDVYNNNIWLVEAIARAATDNRWPRVDVKSGVGPRRQRRLPGPGEEPDEQGPGLPDSRHRARRRLAGRLDPDLCAARHRGRRPRLRPGLFRAAGGGPDPAGRRSDAGAAIGHRSRLGHAAHRAGRAAGRRLRGAARRRGAPANAGRAVRGGLPPCRGRGTRQGQERARRLAANAAAWVVTEKKNALRALVDGQLAKLA